MVLSFTSCAIPQTIPTSETLAFCAGVVQSELKLILPNFETILKPSSPTSQSTALEQKTKLSHATSLCFVTIKGHVPDKHIAGHSLAWLRHYFSFSVCTTLTSVTHCSACTDDTQDEKSKCTACSAGYTIKDDNSQCLCKFSGICAQTGNHLPIRVHSRTRECYFSFLGQVSRHSACHFLSQSLRPKSKQSASSEPT